VPRFLPPKRFFRLPERRLYRILAIVAVVAVALGVAGGVDAALRHGPQPDSEETEPVVANPDSTTGSCGVERWSVKTGTDPDVGKINLQSTTPTTIATMVAIPAPANLPANNRVSPVETTVYQIHATLSEYKLEADSDYHLILVDGSGHTMIAEIPDPACVGSSSPLKTSIQKARAEFDAKYSPTGSFQTANVPVTVTGVGFFDYLHGQTGVAPNGIELHAVLDVQFGSGTGSVTVASPGSQASTIGTPVSLQIHATDTAGGTLSYRATGLPAGLSISKSSGLISGTPTTAATSNVTVTATDSTGPSGSARFSWVISKSGGGGSQLLGNPGFETGTAAPWITTSTPRVINNSSAEPPRSGSWDAWLDGYGHTHTDTLAQTVTIPASAKTATLSFWLHIDTAETTTTTAYDTLKVQVLNSSGTVLSTLATYSNLNAAPGYASHSFDVGKYIGQTITLKFTGREDYEKQTSFVIDDTALNTT
jgi:hypothetical protein